MRTISAVAVALCMGTTGAAITPRSGMPVAVHKKMSSCSPTK